MKAHTRRMFLESSALGLGAALLTDSVSASAETNPVGPSNILKGETMMSEPAAQNSVNSTNVLGGDHFDPSKWVIVPAKTFNDLKVGDVFRAPSRTLTVAHTSEFQAVSCDTHPRHYNDDYARAHNMPAALVQPFQLLAFTAPGASLFTHYVGESIESLDEVSCKFVTSCYVGDTLYPALEIAELTTKDNKGHVLMATVIYNHKGQVVLTGQQKFTLKLL